MATVTHLFLLVVTTHCTGEVLNVTAKVKPGTPEFVIAACPAG